MRFPLSLLLSRPNGPSALSRSSYVFPSRPFTIFVALLWTLSNSLMFFLYCGAQNYSCVLLFPASCEHLKEKRLGNSFLTHTHTESRAAGSTASARSVLGLAVCNTPGHLKPLLLRLEPQGFLVFVNSVHLYLRKKP